MANVSMQAAAAANQDVSSSRPGPFQDCRDVVHISIFFDGTGNNRDADVPAKKWSNVARLYDAALNEKEKSTHRIYVSGVGTKYNGDAVRWLSDVGVWMQDNLGGMGAGAGGTRRLEQGDDAVNDRLRQVLIANAITLGGQVAQYAAKNSAKSFLDLNAALSEHRLIKVINLSIFGFSRGAALARAFSNRVLGACKKIDGKLTYHGYPFSIKFMGIFDTVASFGVPAQNVQLPFDERELVLSTDVQRCVHYVAAHEVRFSFPVDLIRKNGKLAGNWVEKTYPGVHSDVGGGYEPLAQEIDNNYARIPMRDMMSEALVAGVRMLSYKDVQRFSEDIFSERFECHLSTEAAFKNYMAAFGNGGGTIESQMRRHMEVFFSANGTMHRSGIKTPGDKSRQASKYKYLGAKGMAWEIEKYRAALSAGKWVRFGSSVVNSYAQYVKPQDWQLAAWDKTASADVVKFVAHFIHDSKVDFIGNIEPFSYFKPRGVQESTISIWQEGGSWIHDKAEIVSDASRSIYEAGKNKAEAALDVATRAAREVAAAAQRKAQQAADLANEKAAEAADAANRAYDATAGAARGVAEEAKRKADEIAAAAHQKAQQAAEFARRKAQEAEDGTGRLYDAAKRSANNTAAAGSRKMHEVEEGAERMYDRGINWIKHVAEDAGSEVSNAVKTGKGKLSFSD